MEADKPEALWIKFIGFVNKKAQARAGRKEILRKEKKFPRAASCGSNRGREFEINLLIMNGLSQFDGRDKAVDFRMFEG
jgi:hypothetical protein